MHRLVCIGAFLCVCVCSSVGLERDHEGQDLGALIGGFSRSHMGFGAGVGTGRVGAACPNLGLYADFVLG